VIGSTADPITYENHGRLRSIPGILSAVHYDASGRATEQTNFYGGKAGTYHWDTGAGAYPHGSSHLQIHTHEGSIIRILFSD
jgi:hypothetical protein